MSEKIRGEKQKNSSAASSAGAVAAAVEEWKYSYLDQCHSFFPVAIETTGTETMEFLWELGHRLQLVSAEHNYFTNLIQRLSVAVQRGNAASVLHAWAVQGAWSPRTSLRPFDFIVIVYIFFWHL